MKLKKLFAMSLAFIITGALLPISHNISDNVISTAYAEPERMVIYNDEYNSMFEYKSNGQGEIIITKCNPSAYGQIDIPNMIDGMLVTEIGQASFFECENIISVSIPDSVKNINNSAFIKCKRLKSVSLGNGLEIIGTRAFEYCSSLEKITIPDSVRIIDDLAFGDCQNLNSLTLGKGVEKIGCSAFSFCSQLKKVDIPDSVTVICSGAFRYCGLTSVNLNENIKTIENYEFAGNSDLKNIKLPASVESIDNGAFVKCSSLESLVCEKEVSEFAIDAIQGCSNMKSLIIKNPKCTFYLVDYNFEPVTVDTLNEYGNITNKLVIKGYKNSTAETVAKKYGFKFSALSSYGDPNYDEKINSVDASYILSLYAKNAQNKSKPSSDDLECCDINKDGTVNAVDASYILAYYAYTATNKNPVSLTDYMKKK